MFISSSQLDEKNLVLHKSCNDSTIICIKLTKDITKLILFMKKISIDKSQKRKSLIQSREIDEEEHAVFLYHINNMKYFVH